MHGTKIGRRENISCSTKQLSLVRESKRQTRLKLLPVGYIFSANTYEHLSSLAILIGM